MMDMMTSGRKGSDIFENIKCNYILIFSNILIIRISYIYEVENLRGDISYV